MCDKYITCPIKCVSQTSDSPDRNLLCFQCSVIFDSLLVRYTLVIFAQGEQYWCLYLDQIFSLVTTLYNGSDEVAGQEIFAGPYLSDVFNGGLVQHLLQYSRIGQSVCAVVVTCHNHAPAKIQHQQVQRKD